jgi:hypothetical protein
MKLSTLNYQLITFVVVGCITLARGLATEGNSSLSESKIENAEQKITTESLSAQNEDLRKQLSIQQESVKTLTASLAESNAEAEVFRRKYSDLALQMEALGLASASKDRAKLEQRLLAAVSDLRVTQKERESFRDQLLGLNEALLRYLQTSQGGDAQARMDVETQLRRTKELTTASPSSGGLVVSSTSAVTPATQPGLMDGNVLSVKDEWSFVVANIGEQQGVKIGMPLRVMRDEKKIATLRVVDVRQRICGAVIEDSGKEKIKVGDHLQVDARSNVTLK